VFWLGGFSSDPKYPISGEGGPSYAVDGIAAAQRREHDPLQRKWVFPFEVARLQPRATDNFFDESAKRFIEYADPQDVSGATLRRINFWQYTPSKSERPYLYFDTSRHAPGIPDGTNVLLAAYDPPAASDLNPSALHVHAIKTRSESESDAVRIQFANKDKFQILHAGTKPHSSKCRCMTFARIPPKTTSSTPTARSPVTSRIRLLTSPKAPSKRVNRENS
jgi:hypothetical protein